MLIYFKSVFFSRCSFPIDNNRHRCYTALTFSRPQLKTNNAWNESHIARCARVSARPWPYLAARWPTQLIIDFFPKKLFWYWLWTSSHDLCAPLFLTFILRSLRIVGTFYENWVRQIFPMEMNKFLLISLKELHGKFKLFFRHIRIRIMET